MRANATTSVVVLFIAVLVVCAALHTSAQVSAGQTALPTPVMKAFQASYPAATIAQTAVERQDGRPIYRVDSIERGRRRIVRYEASGQVAETAEQIFEKELPAPVAAAMHSHPRAIFVSAMKVSRDARVHYELTLRGTRKTAMVAKPDGTVISFQ